MTLAERTNMDWSEEDAGALLVANLGGRVRQRDPGGGAEQTHDFDIILPTDQVFACEVTRFNDPREVEVDAEIGKRNWHVPGLRSQWSLRRSGRTRVRKLHLRREVLLNTLDRSEIGEGELHIDRLDLSELPYSSESKSALSELLSLGVVGVNRLRQANGTDDVYISYNTTVGASGDSALVRLAEQVMRLEDNLEKLARASEADERHLFVWVEPSAGVASSFVRDQILPEADLELPTVVDRLWLCAASSGARPKSYSGRTGWIMHDSQYHSDAE